MNISLLRFFLLIGVACLAASAALSIPAPSGAKLTFRRVFKGSTPEFIEITVRDDSDTTIRIPPLMKSGSWKRMRARLHSR